jgi:hypothetical protein
MAADALKVSPEGGLMAGRLAPQGIGLLGTPSPPHFFLLLRASLRSFIRARAPEEAGRSARASCGSFMKAAVENLGGSGMKALDFCGLGIPLP